MHIQYQICPLSQFSSGRLHLESEIREHRGLDIAAQHVTGVANTAHE